MDSARYAVNCSILFTELPLLDRPAAADAPGRNEPGTGKLPRHVEGASQMAEGYTRAEPGVPTLSGLRGD
ncbi:hypothetical protein ACIBL3_38955 [Kribbella sp. NPDC050124]|uniref:hypothetical protein n=1 Tax=Kribbella sp. NPDC050124 TaxID=3364114 RepID=UPI0037B88086